MNKFLGTTLAVMMVSVMGFAATGSAGETGEHGDYGSEAENAPITRPEMQTMEQSFESDIERSDQERLQYVPRNMEGSSGTVTGTVTLVGDDMIKIVESDTGIPHEIKVTDAQEKALSTGYTISAELSDGRLVSYQELGIPQNVEEIVYGAENLPDDNILEQSRAF